MRRGGGKSKGSGFERSLAKQIVAAFRKFGIVQRDCWRSVLSGGHMISAGDLVMSERLEKLFPFAVEAKFRKKILWSNFLQCKSEEASWLLQAKQGAAKRDGLIALLVVKANHTQILALRCCGSSQYGKLCPSLVDADGDVWTVSTWTQFLKEAVAMRRA